MMAKSDDEAHKKGFEDNHGPYLVAGTLYRNSTMSTIHYIASNAVITALLSSVVGALGLIKDNLSQLFETIFWVVLVVGVLLVVLTSHKTQINFSRIFTTLGKGFYSYSIIDEVTDQEIRQLRAKGEKEKNFMTKTFTILSIVAVSGFAVVLPTYAVYTGKFFEPQTNNGIIEGLPCVLWLPVKVEVDQIIMTRIILILVEYYIAFTVVAVIIGVVSLDISVGHTLLYEFKVLALAMRTFDKRATFSYHSEDIQPKSAKEALSEKMKLSLKEAIFHHKALMEIAEDYVRIYSIIKFIGLAATTVLLCLSILSLTSDSIPLGNKMLFFGFTLVELSATFVYCWYGQTLLDAHGVIRNALYDSNWADYSSVLGKHVIIILTRTKTPLSLSAGGFAVINLDLWAQVLRTSFSYFSILQALN